MERERERKRGGRESYLTAEKEKGKEGKIGVCFQGLLGGISCFYYTVVFFRVFMNPESVDYNYTVSGIIIY